MTERPGPAASCCVLLAWVSLDHQGELMAEKCFGTLSEWHE